MKGEFFMHPQHLDFLQSLFQILNQDTLKQLAISTGFIQRERAFTAPQFLYFLMKEHAHLIDKSLETLCLNLDDENITMTKSALNKRLDGRAVHFLQALVELVFTHQITHQFPHLNQNRFCKIRILDSTTIQLPASYADEFNGIHAASAKVQLEFDYLTQQILHFQLMNGRDADTPAGWARVDQIQKNELILQDLGYFEYRLLQTLDEKGAYFVTKGKKDIQLFLEVPCPPLHPDGTKIEKHRYQRLYLEEEIASMARGTYKEWSMVYAGRHVKYPVRCFLYRQTKKQEQEMLQREKRRRQKKQKQVAKQALNQVLGVVIYLTNIEEDVSCEEIHAYYQLRWQIELLFKSWKSDLKVGVMKRVKMERWLCHFYTQLLVFYLCQTMTGSFRETLREEYQCLISERKTVREIAAKINRLLADFWKEISIWQATLEKLAHRILKHCQKSIRRDTRRTT